MAEDLVAAQAEFRLRVVGQAIADLRQLADEIVDGHMVRNVDEFLDASAHSLTLPGPRGVKYMPRESPRNRLLVFIPSEIASS